VRAVLDTNIVLDLLHYGNPQLHSLRQAIDGGRLHCFTDRDCLAELQRVSAYPHFRLTAAAQRALLDEYQRFVVTCDENGDGDGCDDDVLPRCRDADDQKFLLLARRCRADLLLTRDRQLLQLAGRHGRRLPCSILTGSAASILIADWQAAARSSDGATDQPLLSAARQALAQSALSCG